tara:strand:+ start:448 stop:1203 length:756 start_codon:yes stop_codon:yes gene_type:complete
MGECIIEIPNLRIDYFKSELADKASIVFIFSPSLNRELAGNLYGGGFFNRLGYHVISIKRSIDDWWQGISNEVLGKIDSFLISQELEKFKRIGYGSSMGGYGAILFSNQLKFDECILFSPQYSIAENFDTRWGSIATKINWKNGISSEKLRSSCKYTFLCDKYDLDRLHIDKYIQLIRKCKSKSITYYSYGGGHPLSNILAEAGVLKETIELLLSGHFTAFDQRLLRHNSITYRINIASKAINKKKIQSGT